MTQQVSLRANMIWNSAGSFISLICQWLITVLVVKLSNSFEAAGVLSICMAIANIFTPIAQFKVRVFQVSDIKDEYSASEYTAFRILTILVALVGSCGYAIATESPATIPAIMLYVVYKLIDSFIDVLHGIDQKNMRMDICGKSMAVRGVLSLLFFCVTMATTKSLSLSIAAMCLSTVPVIPYDWKMAKQYERLLPAISAGRAAELAKNCLPAVLGTACCTAVVSVARQILGDISGAEALGIYASVCTPVVIVQAGAGYIYAPLLGVFAGHIDRNETTRFFQLLIKVLVAMLGLALVGDMVFFIMGKPFLTIAFGAETSSYSFLMYAAIASVMLCAAASFLTDQLIAARESKWVFLGNLIPLVIVIFVTKPLIDKLGMNGCSISISVAYAVGSVLMLIALYRAVKSRK
ncbi:MAG: lipopolysaccharide biosynthesis protein [Collinsella intestinalis]|uniref:Polysaccharide biosynthesis protein n=1 Tax=Collinsella intestinalis TaxID=147207 RepID=A0A6N2YUE0_9ACTN